MIYHSYNSFLQYRSYSHEQIRHKSSHHRSDSSNSVDLFTLINPTNNGSSLSPLICSICSLPMIRPTLLPCQHTFCFNCLQNNQQLRPGSLPIHSHSSSLINDHHTKLVTCQKCFRTHSINSLSDLKINESIELLINTLLCETCHQLYPSNQLDTCAHCFSVFCPNCYNDHFEKHQNEENNHFTKQSSDNQILKSQSFNIETISSKPVEKSENTEMNDSVQSSHSKKRSTNLIKRFLNSSRHRSSSKDSTSSLKISSPPKLNLAEISKTETIPTPPIPVTPVRKFLNLFDQYSHIDEHIKQCEQRQSELERSVKKLIEVLTIKTNENLSQISIYWINFKQLLLEEYENKTNRFQLFGYLVKNCCTTFNSPQKILEGLNKNDEINAALQVLSTTLIIIHDQQNLFTINQLFDREEQTTIRKLKCDLETLLSLYNDELSFLNDRVKDYQSRCASWKNSNINDLELISYEWTQIIEHDYPALIEKISNDFITKIPQVEKILISMLRSMKQRLLKKKSSNTKSKD